MKAIKDLKNLLELDLVHRRLTRQQRAKIHSAIKALKKAAAVEQEAARYRYLREKATIRSDCGTWVISCGDSWLPVPESEEFPTLHENTEEEPCDEALCDAAVDLAMKTAAKDEDE